MSATVAHIIGRYLPLTQTFIYQLLKHAQEFKPAVVAESVENLELFPHDPLYLVQRRSGAGRAYDKIAFRLRGRRPIKEARYLSLLADKNVRLIHGHFGWSAQTSLPLKQRLNLPLVTSFYGVDVSALPRRPEWLKFYQGLFRQGDLFLVEGNYMRQSLMDLGCPPEKIAVHHIGVDLEQIIFRPRRPPKDGPITVLMAGSLIPKKGVTFGLEAFSEVARQRGDIRLVVIGDGHMRPQIESLIRELNVGKSVSLLGYLSHEAYLAQAAKAHIFMAPSLTDDAGDSEGGAPTVLLEMQAAGVPVLSTFHADIPEVVPDQVSGYLVPEKDTQALAERLAALVEHPEQWDEMGRAGRRHVEQNHNIRLQSAELAQKYRRVLQ